MEKQAALDLLEFIHESPTNFHAVLSIKQGSWFQTAFFRRSLAYRTRG